MKAIVLLSGGVDSATCLGLAVDKHGRENVAALSVFYGQKHDKELKCARALVDYYDVKHYEVDLSSTMQFSNCSLLKQSSEEIAHTTYAEQQKDSKGNPVATYVPFRNGLMLSTVGTLALSIFPDEQVTIYYGAHADDAAGNAYPDCSWDFVKAMSEALYQGSGKLLILDAPFVNMNKAALVSVGLKLKVPYKFTWSCYEGKDKACGVCGTCRDRLAAFKANGMEDPIEYDQR